MGGGWRIPSELHYITGFFCLLFVFFSPVVCVGWEAGFDPGGSGDGEDADEDLWGIEWMDEKADAVRCSFLLSAPFRFRKQCSTAISTASDYALRNTPLRKYLQSLNPARRPDPRT